LLIVRRIGPNQLIPAFDGVLSVHVNGACAVPRCAAALKTFLRTEGSNV
jgi:hypothetical protein